MMKLQRFAVLVITATSMAIGSSADAQPLQNQLRAYWNFDTLDDAGADGATFGTDFFADQSGNGNSAVIMREGNANNFTNTAPQSTTVPSPNFGMSFRTTRGTADNDHTFTSTADNSLLDFKATDPFTFSVWSYSNYAGTFNRGNLFSKVEDSITPGDDVFDVRDENIGYIFSRRGGNNETRFEMMFSDDTTGFGDIYTIPSENNNNEWDNGKWALWTITNDGAGTLRAYVNGQLRLTDSVDLSLDWSNGDPFTIADRENDHQRSFAWPTGQQGEAFIDDLGVIGEDLTGAEAASIYNLATNADLGYALGDVLKLLDLHREADPDAEAIIGDLRWVFSDDPGAFSGGLGEVAGSGSDFSLLLGNGTGVITQAAAAVPEPQSVAIWTILSAASVGFVVWRRRRRA